MIETSPAAPIPARRSRLRRVLPAGVIVALIAAWGSDRQPADAGKPVVWHTPPSIATIRPRDELRIASFNIHGGKGRDGRFDLARTAAALHDVDFVGLYEVHAAPWGAPADQAADLGERLAMRSAFAGTERRWWHEHFGNALLINLPVEFVQRIPLANTRGKAYRQAVLVVVPLGDQTVRVVLAHIDRQQDREHQLAAVIRLFQSLQAPAILMGDLNTEPSDPQLRDLLAQSGVESSLHAKLGGAAPKDNIDWLITRGLECIEAEYSDTGASDHPVIKATLRLRSEPPAN